MALLWKIALFGGALALAQNTTIVTLFDGANCSSQAPQYVWEPLAQNATDDGGNCIEKLPSTALSLIFSQLQQGCSGKVPLRCLGHDLTICPHNSNGVLGRLLQQ